MTGIPANTTRWTLQFQLAAGELALTSFWTVGAAATSDSALAGQVGQIVNALDASSLKAAIKALYQVDATLAQVKGYSYPTGGPTAAHVATQGAPAGWAGTGTSPHPLQTAMVVSLHTAFAGRRNRGRMYLPASGVDMSGQFLSSTRTSGIANGFGAFFTAVNALSPSVGLVSVISQMDTAARPVFSVSVDNRPDIQRRRADRQVATNTATAAVS